MLDISKVISRLALSHCSLIKGNVLRRLDSNSIIHCSEWFSFQDAIKTCFPYIGKTDIKIGLNFVEINGNIPSEEDLHIHISMLIAIVVEGKGIMRYEKDGVELKELVEVGDMIFIPRNAPHYFEGLPVIKYSAIEFGPEIDYQKHHKLSKLND